MDDSVSEQVSQLRLTMLDVAPRSDTNVAPIRHLWNNFCWLAGVVDPYRYRYQCFAQRAE